MTVHQTEGAIITESFNALKKSARSDEDVLKWFKEHAFCLPDVPEILIPYLVLSVNEDRTHTFMYSQSDKLIRRYTLEYTAQLPASQLRGKDADICAGLLAIHGTVDNKINPYLAVENHWALSLDLLEWPYAAALAGYDVITSLGLNNPQYEDKIRNMWETVFPDKPWNVVLSLYNADLTPDNELAFTQWACSDTIDAPIAIHLPEEYLP